MAVDPIDAALDAIAAHIGAQSGIATARRGWPEHATDLDLSQGPVVTVTHAGDQRTQVAPGLIGSSKPFLWRTAELRITAQLDLWTAYRAQRDDAARIVEAALNDGLPWRTGLHLTSTAYHGRPLTVASGDGRSMDEEKAATEGEWRRTWMLEVLTDLVAETATPAQDEITIRPTAGGIAESDFDVT